MTGAASIALAPHHKCHCGEDASRLVRCRKCLAVVARCTAHGDRLEEQRDRHCPKP